MRSWLLFFILLCPSVALGASFQDAIFSEIAWMGTTVSANDEWLEIYNNTASAIDLNGWKIVAEDGSPSIALQGAIAPMNFFVLERTNDETLPNINAQQIYTGALENSGENLKLYDQNNNLIDEIKAEGSWLAGDNATKQTMVRRNSLWQNSKTTGGTPGATNDYAIVSATSSPVLEKNISPIASVLPAQLVNPDQKNTPKDDLGSKTLFLGLLIAGFSGIILVVSNKLFKT